MEENETVAPFEGGAQLDFARKNGDADGDRSRSRFCCHAFLCLRSLSFSLSLSSYPLALSVLSLHVPQDGLPGLRLAVDGQLRGLRRDEPPPERNCNFFEKTKGGMSEKKKKKKKKKSQNTSNQQLRGHHGLVSLRSRRLQCRSLCSTRPAKYVWKKKSWNETKKDAGRILFSFFCRLATAAAPPFDDERAKDKKRYLSHHAPYAAAPAAPATARVCLLVRERTGGISRREAGAKEGVESF